MKKEHKKIVEKFLLKQQLGDLIFNNQELKKYFPDNNVKNLVKNELLYDYEFIRLVDNATFSLTNEGQNFKSFKHLEEQQAKIAKYKKLNYNLAESNLKINEINEKLAESNLKANMINKRDSKRNFNIQLIIIFASIINLGIFIFQVFFDD